MAPSLRRVLTAPVTVATFLLLVVPLALGWLRTSLLSPLALPGYLIYTIGSAIGNLVAPRLDLWVYWIPFLAGCYGIAVTIGYVFEFLADRLESR
ncbi:hypothetical protein C491_16292 [Natronococcus amylolyticus DSM 10524]|uniref:Uncharacterized protein n=1 Tax=Natronococcus amylolyticus DSM 10524 TaxID=1227497 RepID=L9X0Z5_9EURY|nr:hypothetical protein [Natronococcus amylolyticus]ELY55292.1 hypothetical protein C491_16292 [Natronococcus amylolyticus DSM 10524]